MKIQCSKPGFPMIDQIHPCEDKRKSMLQTGSIIMDDCK